MSTNVLFWSAASPAEVEFVSVIPQSAPMQLQVLMDVNGQSLSEANQLADVLLNGSLDKVFGGALGAGSNISVRLYTEAPTSGPLISIGGGSVFTNTWNGVSDAIGVSYLLANKQKPSTTPTSARLLELASEILASWPTAQSTPNAVQVLVIVTPNNIITSNGQWSQFEAAVRQSMVLPIFYSPSAGLAPWQDSITTLWASAFPDYPTAPIALGTHSIEDIWAQFDIKAALTTALGFIGGSASTSSGPSSTPVVPSPSSSPNPPAAGPGSLSSSHSLSPLIISASSTTDLTLIDDVVTIAPNGAGSRKVSFSLALNASVNPLSAPSTYTAGILGTRPITFTSSMQPSPSGTNAIIPIQNPSTYTPLAIPVSDDTLAINISSLPTQGILASNGVPITSLPFRGPPQSFSYKPNEVRGEGDSFLYMLQLPCGLYGNFEMLLNLSYVPIKPIVLSNITITLDEDDMSNHLVNFTALVERSTSGSSIVLLSLANMAGNLTHIATNSEAALTTRYPTASAAFNFKNYAPGRGARSFNITYVIDNGMGAYATGVVFFTITDVLHVPSAFTQKPNTVDSTFVLVSDIDGDDIITTVTANNLHTICWYNMTTSASTCSTDASFTFTVPSPTLISIQRTVPLVDLNPTVSWTVQVKDATQSATNSLSGQAQNVNGLLGALLGGLLNLVGSLLQVLLGLPTSSSEVDMRINFTNGVPEGYITDTCYFPQAPTAAKMRWLGSDPVTNGYSVNWADSAEHYANYRSFRGVSGPDAFFFQCSFKPNPSTSNNFAAGFFVYLFNIAIPKPSASSLTIDKDPFSESIFIPIQGLVSAGGLSITNIITDAASQVVQVAGGLRFFPSSAASTLTYTLCSVLNTSLCTGPITNTINTIASLPILGSASQPFYARLNNYVNTFTLDLPENTDGIIVQSLGLLRSGTVVINGVTLTASTLNQYIPSDGTFTFQIEGALPVTADLLSIFSFTFVAVSRGFPSQPGTVYILPVATDLLSVLPTITNAVSTLVSELNTTLDIVSTLIPGFRVELDIFGKKSAQGLYTQLEAAIAAQKELNARRALRSRAEAVYGAQGKMLPRAFALASSSYDSVSGSELVALDARDSLSPDASVEDVTFSATMIAPPSGKLELCEADGTCIVIPPGQSFTVSYDQTVFLTPPLLTDLVDALGTLTWNIAVLVDGVVSHVVNGAVQLANDLVSDTLRGNVLNNVAEALTRSVPGVRNLLVAAGLDPNGCGGVVPPSPFVCYQGQLIANASVIINQTLSVDVPETRIINGDFSVTSQGSLILQFVDFYSLDLSFLPFFNVSGDFNAEGPIQVNATEEQLEKLVFAHTPGGTRDAYFANYYEQLRKRDAEQGPDATPESTIPEDAPVDSTPTAFAPSTSPQVPITTAPTSSPVAAPSATVESRGKKIIEATNVTTQDPAITLITLSKCYSMKTTKSRSGSRMTLMTIFVFNPDRDNSCVPPSPSDYVVDPTGRPIPGYNNNPNSPAKKQRSYYIIIGVCVGIAVLVIVVVIIVFLVFRYSGTAKRAARPYRVRRVKGQSYRTQPNGGGGSTDSSSYGSAEMLVRDDSPRNGPSGSGGAAAVPALQNGFSAEMDDPVSASYDEESEEMEYDSDNDSLPDETEDDGEMPRSLPSHSH